MAPAPTMRMRFISGYWPSAIGRRLVYVSTDGRLLTALSCPFDLHVLLRLTPPLSLYLFVQRAGVVIRIVDEDAVPPQCVLQSGADGVQGSASTFTHPFRTAVTVRRRRHRAAVLDHRH